MARLVVPVILTTALVTVPLVVVNGFSPVIPIQKQSSLLSFDSTTSQKASSCDDEGMNELSRRDWMNNVLVTAATTAAISTGTLGVRPEPASAVGPVKINLLNPTYTAIPCPKDKPIPGEKAMKGMNYSIQAFNV